MLQGDDRIYILPFHGHYVGVVDGEVIVSGDNWTEVYRELLEMGYLK